MEALIKPISYILTIILAAILTNRGFLEKNVHRLLSVIVINITLPAVIIRAFAQTEQKPELYFIIVFGFLFTFIPLIVTYLLTFKRDKKQRSLYMINLSGYNIGCFAIPVIEAIFGAPGVVIACMFDAGSGILSTGGAYAITSALLKLDGENESPFKAIPKKLLRSVPFLTYILVFALKFMDISIPETVVKLLDPVASANSFLSMFMVGSIISFNMKKEHILKAVGFTAVRSLICFIFALICVFLMPFDAFTKTMLIILSFAPIASLAPVYTDKCNADVEFAGIINPLSIAVSLLVTFILL